MTVTGSILSGNISDKFPQHVDVDRASARGFEANHSLIGVAASGQLDAGSDNIINDNPQLAPLADNGGRTKTHVLLPGSPAIDAGDPDFESPPLFDQRGAPFPRVVNGRIDVGAYEFQPPPTSPAPLLLDAVSSTEVQISWTDSRNEIGYRLYQWVHDKGVEIASFEADETTHLVSGLQPDTKYSFSLEAFNPAKRVFVGWDEVSTPLDDVSADLTGNGFVDFEDLTVLLANWTGPSPAGAPVGRRLAAALETALESPTGWGSGFERQAESEAPRQAAAYGSATGGASYRLRRGAPRSRPESGIYRLQAVAVDGAMREEQIFEPTQRTFARRTPP